MFFLRFCKKIRMKILAFAELEIRVKTVDMLHRDGTIEKLEERLERLKKEARTHEEQEIC